jgi:hypothetical protein
MRRVCPQRASRSSMAAWPVRIVRALAPTLEGVLGGIGWFGFLLCALLLIVWGIVALVRRRRTTAAA